MLSSGRLTDTEDFTMNRTALSALVLTGLSALLLSAVVADDSKEKPDDKGFESIFDGKTLEGWQVSATSGHSGASKHRSGGRWVVEEKATSAARTRPATAA
jgi:hypothetical protein